MEERRSGSAFMNKKAAVSNVKKKVTAKIAENLHRGSKNQI